MKFHKIFFIGCCIAATSLTTLAQHGETVKIAWIDPLSGLMAAVGTNQLKTFQFLASEFNRGNAAGVKYEIIALDNKLSSQETAAALRSAVDQGVRYVVQGDGAGPALAIIDALEKHNARNPGNEVLYLDYAAADPDLTNSRCSYWHFRLDAHSEMKMQVLAAFMKERAEIKKVYLINQNYSHGQQISKYAKENLKTKRPDIEIVGDDLHPLAQVRDFAPYVAKIKASGADTVVSGNWGSDLALLIKAATEAGLNVKFYIFYAFGAGTPMAMGAASDGKVYQVGFEQYNAPHPIAPLMSKFKKATNDDLTQYSAYHVFALLDAAFSQAKSTAPMKVASAMEGMKFKSFNGVVEMRKADHQLQQGLWITRWQKTDSKSAYSAENTGYTLAAVKYYDPGVATTPTNCQMKRPS